MRYASRRSDRIDQCVACTPVLGVRENREAVFAGRAERREARRQRAAKIMRG
jgi:hypothetical protein